MILGTWLKRDVRVECSALPDAPTAGTISVSELITHMFTSVYDQLLVKIKLLNLAFYYNLVPRPRAEKHGMRGGRWVITWYFINNAYCI